MAAEPQSPVLPLTTRFKLSIGSVLMKLCKRSDGTFNRRLFSILIDLKTPPNSSAVIGSTLVSSSDISINPSRSLWFRLFSPQTTEKLPLIVYFHGGGFSSFNPDSKYCDSFCRILAGNVPAVVASVNYRLTPKHRYPCQYEDGLDALRFIDAQNYAVLPANTDLGRCFLAGDSAGGNIAHHVGLMASQSPQVFDKIILSGLVALQPFFGGEERTESELRLTRAPILNVDATDTAWEMFLPEGCDRDHPAVNIFGTGGKSNQEILESVKFPRSLVIVGGFDILQDWQKMYAEGLKKCGKQVELVEFPNAFHGFYCFQELPEFGLCIQHIKKFIHD